MGLELSGITPVTVLFTLVRVIVATIAATQARTGHDALEGCRLAEQQVSATGAESLDHAKGAALTTPQNVSPKLIADHMRKNKQRKSNLMHRLRIRSRVLPASSRASLTPWRCCKSATPKSGYAWRPFEGRCSRLQARLIIPNWITYASTIAVRSISIRKSGLESRVTPTMVEGGGRSGFPYLGVFGSLLTSRYLSTSRTNIRR